MRDKLLRNIATFSLTLTLAATPIFAGGKKPSKKQQKPLEEKSDPTLIGKRNINKGSIDFYSLDREVALGRQLSAEVDRSSKFLTDPQITEYVNRIGQNIVLHSDAKVPFTIKVIDSNEVNAFALPGGFLYVNRGLLEAADNEAEVAGVLSHEIAHVTARHGVEQASKGQLLNYASLPLIFFGGIGGYVVQQVANLAVPLTFLKFSRGAEREADLLGSQYMWAAGYDPNALITFFEKLQAKEKNKPGTLSKVFSTHPPNSDRIKEVRELIARFPERGEYQITSSEFSGLKSRLAANSANSRSINSGDNKRPTLKRRPQSGEDGSGDSTGSTDTSSSPANDRPVLKRRDGTSTKEDDPSKAPEEPSTNTTGTTTDKPAADKPAENKPADATGRPTLKRKTDSNDN